MQLAGISHMRHDWHSECFRQHADDNKLAYAGDAEGIDLAKAEAVHLQIILEEDAVGHMLAGGDLGWSNLFGNCAMSENIIGVGRLFDPVQIEVFRLVAELQRPSSAEPSWSVR